MPRTATRASWSVPYAWLARSDACTARSSVTGPCAAGGSRGRARWWRRRPAPQRRAGSRSTQACSRATARERRSSSAKRSIQARRYGDTDLEFSTTAFLGASLVHSDRTEEGMLLLDEALAAAAGGDVEDFLALEEIFCQFFSACEHAHDVTRADQWMRVGAAVAARRNLPVVTAFCRTHYGGVLTAAGRWPEADATLTEAVRLWGLGQRSGLREGALVRLADLRVRQGRIDEAAQLLDGLDPAANAEAARPVAAIHIARGETALARDVLERALEQLEETSTASAQLLTLLVDVQLASQRARRGERDSRQAGRVCRGAPDRLRPRGGCARARKGLPRDGDRRPPGLPPRRAGGFARAQTPMELARCRLALAGALAADRPEVAVAEARAAFDAFDQLRAARDADAAGALLRSLGAKPASTRPGGSAPDQARGRGPRPDRPWAVEPRDLRPALHQPQDRGAPRRKHPGQARPAEPDRSGRLRRPGEIKPPNRGPPRSPIARKGAW